MKVVLFCGGLGTRLREHSEEIPKPLVTIGYRPIIWHLMRYYSHFGHNDFVLCLGYRGDMIREYFLNYNECMSNDFTMLKGGKDIHLHKSDIDDWNITFVDTGLHANIGQRLCAVRKYVENEEMFLANYSDGLSDLNFNKYLEAYSKTSAVGGFVAVRPTQSFHAIKSRDDGVVTQIGSIHDSEFWINGGFFIFKNQIFDYIQEGEELVEEPFKRLIREEKLYAHKFEGFWTPMDTFKDKINYDRMYARGEAPWEKWKS
jgi:glucose-1-phosphate cytidylyltransferase